MGGFALFGAFRLATAPIRSKGALWALIYLMILGLILGPVVLKFPRELHQLSRPWI